MNESVLRLALGAAAMLLCADASAHEAGEWRGRVGFHYVDPKADNHDVVGVEGAGTGTAAVSYFVTPTLAVDLLVALPFEHDVELEATGDEVAQVRHLPPTLSIAWFPDVPVPVKPFVGAGLNYTLFFDEKTRGALDGARLHLDDSFGLALMAGFEYALSRDLSVIVDVRYFDIDSQAELDGDSLGDIHIDPWAYGAALAYRF
jgi:outer membrane protein